MLDIVADFSEIFLVTGSGGFQGSAIAIRFWRGTCPLCRSSGEVLVGDRRRPYDSRGFTSASSSLLALACHWSNNVPDILVTHNA